MECRGVDCKSGEYGWPHCLVHRAGHPELRLEQILCVLPHLQAPPQLLQLRFLLSDAVVQVLDLGLRGLQLALLARRPKLLLQVVSHRREPTLALKRPWAHQPWCETPEAN